MDWTREAEKGFNSFIEDDTAISRSQQPGSLDLIFRNISRGTRQWKPARPISGILSSDWVLRHKASWLRYSSLFADT